MLISNKQFFISLSREDCMEGLVITERTCFYTSRIYFTKRFVGYVSNTNAMPLVYYSALILNDLFPNWIGCMK